MATLSSGPLFVDLLGGCGELLTTMTSLERQQRLNRTRLESVVYASEELLRAHVRREFQTRFPLRDWRNGAGANAAIPTLGSSLPPMLRKRLLHEDDSTWDTTLLNAVLLGLLENQSGAKARALRQASYQVVAVRNSCAHAAGGRVTEKEFAAHWKTARIAVKTLGGDADAIMRTAMSGEDAQHEGSETPPIQLPARRGRDESHGPHHPCDGLEQPTQQRVDEAHDPRDPRDGGAQEQEALERDFHIEHPKTQKEKRKERKEQRDKLKKEKNDKKEINRKHTLKSAVKSKSSKSITAHNRHTRDTYGRADSPLTYYDTLRHVYGTSRHVENQDDGYNPLKKLWRRLGRWMFNRMVPRPVVVFDYYDTQPDPPCCSSFLARVVGIVAVVWLLYHFRDSALESRVVAALQGLWESIRSGYDELQVGSALEGFWESVCRGYGELKEPFSHQHDPSLRGSDGNDSRLARP